MLGSGAYSTVYAGYFKDDKTPIAIKCVKTENMSAEDRIALQEEVRILGMLNHPNIIRLESYIEKDEKKYIITEKVPEGITFVEN